MKQHTLPQQHQKQEHPTREHKPVLMTKKALEASPSAKCFEIIVDNGTAKENVTRFAQNAGFTVSVSEDGDDFHLTLKK